MQTLKSIFMKSTLIILLTIIGAFSVAAPSVNVAFYVKEKKVVEELPIDHDNKFIKELTPKVLKILAEEKEKGMKVPLPSVVLAMAYHETAQGKTALAKKGNNYFGIKASKACKKNPKCLTMSLYDDDYRVIKGKRTKVKSKFQTYKTLDDNLRHYVEKLNGNLYVKALSKKTSKEQIHIIAKNWATDPLYTTKINNIIKHHDLNEFDKDFL